MDLDNLTNPTMDLPAVNNSTSTSTSSSGPAFNHADDPSSNAPLSSQLFHAPPPLPSSKGKHPLQGHHDAGANIHLSHHDSHPSSFSGATHPPEPVDADIISTVYVPIGQANTHDAHPCLINQGGGPFMEDLSIIHAPAPAPPNINPTDDAACTAATTNFRGSRSSTFSIHRTSLAADTSLLLLSPETTDEKECVWDASFPPTPRTSRDMSTTITAFNTCCTSNQRSDALTSAGTAVDSTTFAAGDSHDSARSSVSSDDSSWSHATATANKPHKGNDPRGKAILAVRSRHGMLGMSHFRLLKRLGCGDIGTVYLSQLTGTTCYFAMKVMDKASLATRNKLTRAHTEREILQLLDHPFLPTLYTHFETHRFTCLVMDFCPGGDLHTLRQRQPANHFSEYAVRFYAAEILLALEYLHMLGVVYRDLKPENVLVRDDGHIMLSDFDLSLRCSVSPTLIKGTSFGNDPSKQSSGSFCVQPACIEPTSVCIQPACFMPKLFSKKNQKNTKQPRPETVAPTKTLPELVVEPTAARSMSFVGTHEYLAPEIIKGEGHGSAVDWWTFGIFLYELLYGRTPFKGSGNRATLFNVVGQQLKFPESPPTSYSSRDLIRGLLVKEPQHRLGVKRGAAEIKQHPFFEGVNWALIRCSTPPEVPRPVEPDLVVKYGASAAAMSKADVGTTVEVKSNSKRMVAGDMKSEGKYLDFEFF